jgi:hypothetical protein
MIKDLSPKLVAAVAAINQKSREAFVAEQQALQQKQTAKQLGKMPGVAAPKADAPASANAKKMAEESEGTTPKTEKEKKLAALRPPANKITHGDVLHGRGVRKEEAEQADEAMSHQAATTMKHIPNASPALKKAAKDIKPGVSGYRDRIAMLKAGGVKEQAEVATEGWDDKEPKGTGKFDRKEIKPGVVQYTRKSSTFDDGSGKDSDERKMDREKRKSVKEENLDTPGNSTHQCAIHVKSEQFGEGRTLTSQHAEPDAQGNIAWYDVMFAEGIKRVFTEDIEVLVSESHMMHKKKKAK